MTKVECLKIIYEALGGSDEIVPHEETACDILHKIGNCIGNFIEELETINTYTTEETKIGTWIDGKPVYRKVINSTVENIENELNVLGADTVVSFYGQALSTYGNWFPIPCKNSATTDYSGTDSYTIDFFQSNLAARNFAIRFGAYYKSTNKVYVIIKYTKKGGLKNA